MLRTIDTRSILLVFPFTDTNFYKGDQFEIYSKNFSIPFEVFIDDFLIKTVYPSMIKNYDVYHLEEIRLLVKQYFWKLKYHQKGTSISDYYLQHLSELAKVFLTHRNGQISLKYWESAENNGHESKLLGPYSGVYKIAIWNSLNRVFTTDLLAIIYLINHGMDEEYNLKSFSLGISIADTQLEQILNKGLAETHLHFNAAGNFDHSWQLLMSNKRVKDEVFDSFYLDNDIIINIKSLSIIRIIMALYLNDSFNSPSICFKQYLNSIDFNINNTVTLLDLFETMASGASLEGMVSTQELSMKFEELKFKLDLKSKDLKCNDINCNFGQQDVIHKLLMTYGEYNTVERVFLLKCIKYLYKYSENNTFFQKIFWQYIRLKNTLFQTHVQRNNVRGLEYFSNHFNRATGVRLENEVQRMNLLLNYQATNRYLRKLEIRMSVGKGKSIESKRKSLAEKIKHFFKAYLQLIKQCEFDNTNAPAIGIIIHFIKGKEKKTENLYDTYCYYIGNYYQEMYAILELRQQIEGLSDYLVGIDAAGEEMLCEPWVFSNIFKKARDSKSQRLFYDSKYNHIIQNLGLTYHVGEDFRHILTGLRWIDEVVEHFQYHAGDRLGHAIALGIIIDRWVSENPVIILPRIEHLENMLWIWEVLRKGRCTTITDIPFIEYEIINHAQEIIGNVNSITIQDLLYIYKSKFSILEYNYESNKVVPNYKVGKGKELLKKFFECDKTYQKMMEPIQIKLTELEINLIKEMQKMLIQDISKKGIVIETNPSSNTAINKSGSIFDHYIQHLNPIKREVGQFDLQVSINTDDPIVFNTNINNEFAYIFFALQEKGYSREELIRWIDQIREHGLQSSFIRTRELSNKDRIDEIEEILIKLNEKY